MDKQVFIINGSGCVDCDTEFFNGTKWKKISEYQNGDMVLQYNKDGSAELVQPLDYIKNKNEKLNLFENKSLNMCLSDEHMCYYITSKNNLYGKKFVDIKNDFNNSKSGFDGRFITAFNYNTNARIDLTDSEIKLMIAIIADGHFRNDSTNLCYLNLKKDRKKEEFRKICNECGIKYTEKQYPSMPDYSRFFIKAPRHEKYFSSYWYNCSLDQLKLISENILKWDGNNKNTFYTNNKESADFVQFVFSSLGYNASINIYDRRSKKHYKTIEYSVIKSDKILHKMDKDYRNNNLNEIKEYYTIDGYEYCFTVPSGMWVMRRNNKICITGNCSGKDTFVELVNLNFKSYYTSVMNYSSVDKVKEVAKLVGWDGRSKTEKDRKFLSDLKLLCTEYNDMPFNYMKEKVEDFYNNAYRRMLFLHIREPEEIERAKNAFDAKTILVRRDSIEHITSNMADKNVYNYDYDIAINNDGTMQDLEDIAIKFIEDFENDCIKNEY